MYTFSNSNILSVKSTHDGFKQPEVNLGSKGPDAVCLLNYNFRAGLCWSLNCFSISLEIMRRSSYEQIIDWKTRQGDPSRLGMRLISDIQALGEKADSVADIAIEYTNFIPIRLVTILEVFLRGVIAELVNSDKIYFERGEKLVKGAKVDLAFAFHVNRHELTIGDFVAHAVSINSLGNVTNFMDTLLGNFSSKLRTSHPRWEEEKGDWPLTPIIEDYDKTMKSLARLYQIRNILTHELPVEAVFDTDEIPALVEATKVFVDATDWVVVKTIHGSIPHTQTVMNIGAGNDLRLAEEALNQELDNHRLLGGVDQETLDALQEAWVCFADLQASFVASQVEGGSMYPMMWAGEKSALLRERIKQLDRIKKEWMDS